MNKNVISCLAGQRRPAGLADRPRLHGDERVLRPATDGRRRVDPRDPPLLEAGGNFLDTADMYGVGRNEVLVGKAIAGRRDRSSWPRSSATFAGPTASSSASAATRSM